MNIHGIIIMTTSLILVSGMSGFCFYQLFKNNDKSNDSIDL
jgi:hypothetical protein